MLFSCPMLGRMFYQMNHITTVLPTLSTINIRTMLVTNTAMLVINNYAYNDRQGCNVVDCILNTGWAGTMWRARRTKLLLPLVWMTLQLRIWYGWASACVLKHFGIKPNWLPCLLGGNEKRWVRNTMQDWVGWKWELVWVCDRDKES